MELLKDWVGTHQGNRQSEQVFERAVHAVKEEGKDRCESEKVGRWRVAWVRLGI